MFDIGICLICGRWLFRALSAVRHAGGPRVHKPPVCAPAYVRVACSGRSKLRKLGSDRGICFGRARACQDIANSTMEKTRLTAVCGKNGHIANYTGTHIVLTRNMVLYREFVTSKQGVLLKNTSPTATYQE